MQDIHFKAFQIDDNNSNLVAILSNILEHVMKPTMLSTNAWGELLKKPEGSKDKENFIKDFEGFLSYLESKNHFPY